MVEARKCARCGCMYISETEVCEKCERRDGADLYRLKGFFDNQEIGETITQNELAIATGISNRNLIRFLEYDEFKRKNIFAGAKTKAVSGEANEEESFVELV